MAEKKSGKVARIVAFEPKKKKRPKAADADAPETEKPKRGGRKAAKDGAAEKKPPDRKKQDAGGEKKDAPAAEGRLALTKVQLAGLVGYSVQQLFNINRELPEESKLFVKTGKGYDAETFVRRWVNLRVELAKDTGKRELSEVKAEHEEVKMEKTRLEVQRIRGEQVDVMDVRKIWGDIAGSVKNKMLALPNRIAPQVVEMKSVEMIADITRREIVTALEELSETPLPAYLAAGDDPEEDEEEEE